MPPQFDHGEKMESMIPLRTKQRIMNLVFEISFSITPIPIAIYAATNPGAINNRLIRRFSGERGCIYSSLESLVSLARRSPVDRLSLRNLVGIYPSS